MQVRLSAHDLLMGHLDVIAEPSDGSAQCSAGGKAFFQSSQGACNDIVGASGTLTSKASVEDGKADKSERLPFLLFVALNTFYNWGNTRAGYKFNKGLNTRKSAAVQRGSERILKSLQLSRPDLHVHDRWFGRWLREREGLTCQVVSTYGSSLLGVHGGSD